MMVVFVCTGNSCRSPMAEGFLRKMLSDRGDTQTRVISAGTSALEGRPPTPEAVAAMAEAGIDISAHRSRRLTPDTVGEAGLIVGMAESHVDAVVAMDPTAIGKLYLLRDFASERGFDRGIRDPIGQSIDEYRAVRDDIRVLVARMAERMQP